MFRFSLVITFVSLLGTACGADPPTKVDPNPASLAVPTEIDLKARQWVRLLGERSFEVREQAQSDLRELGRLALPALIDGYQNSTELEIVERCDQLIPRALNLDIRARVDCFVADTEAKYDHKLPAAKEFFAITGRTEAARKLFRDLLLSSNRDLITSIEGPVEQLAAKAVARRTELYPRNTVVNGVVQRMTPPSALDIIGLLFVESTFPEKALTAAGNPGGGVAVTSPTVLVTQASLRTALESDACKEPMRAITTKWFETREEVRTISLCMSSAATLKLPVTKTMAKKVIDGVGFTPLNKAQAMCNIAKLGDVADLDLIAPMLKDDSQASPGLTTIVNGVQHRSPIQMRDVALAMSLQLAKQNPTEFGMVYRYASTTSTAATAETLKYSYYSYYFDDANGEAESKRKAAFEKWDAWKAKNLKAELKKDEKK